jgi:hypothetical protein
MRAWTLGSRDEHPGYLVGCGCHLAADYRTLEGPRPD